MKAEHEEKGKTNLSESQKEEMARQNAHEDLKTAKEAEIAAGQAQIETKTHKKADKDEKDVKATAGHQRHASIAHCR